MKTVLMTNRYTGEPLSILRAVIPSGFDLRFLEEQNEACLRETVAEADYLLAGGRLRVDRDILENARHLKMIQRSGVGLDTLDLEAIKARQIPLYVNQGVNAESVAEHALLLILACLRRLPEIAHNTKNGIWKKQEQGIRTVELRGKTVGLIGMGNITKTLVGLLKPFHVRILYTNLFQMSSEYEAENNMEFVSTEELMENSDIISIHCALTDETRNLINRSSIGRMKTGAILVNTARGGIVDPAVAAEALESGKLAFVGLDVHSEEPIPDDYPLKSCDHAILTPHIAGVTADSFRAMMHDAFRNIACFDQGRLEEIAQYRYL